MKPFSWLMGFALLSSPAVMPRQAPSVAPASQVAPQMIKARSLRPVTVIGIVPGPDLWRVRKGRHVLWILGTLDEWPEQMHWRAVEVRRVIAQAGEVLDIPRVRIHASTGYFDRLALNPDGRKLRDVVPPRDYEKWSKLKAAYMGKDDAVENRRPVYAAVQLYLTSLKHAGLAPDMIEPVIADLLKQRGLTPLPVIYNLEPARGG
ncbi:TraB/GumN family protein [Rhodanobacter sp. L36]|uniref:TraB/GumN family protein n=1 Tax=Rhodanobacter sp. L36 TaxID=1747221 RepID=UPI00131DF8A6|nr:TraB/GumN family protein [Rhodanobacter sp. L36]